MDVVKTVAMLDASRDLDEARLLILLTAFAGSDGDGAIEGLTKLAKLDFLLRYPVMLQRALVAKKASTRAVKLEEHEEHSVESSMVRYRFGPWDHRYRELLNVLSAKGLVKITLEGRMVVIAATKEGRAVSANLTESELFAPYLSRAALLKRYFDISATHLMRFIYNTFPEIVSLRSNAPIIP